MAKILLDSKPFNSEDCPFGNGSRKCDFTKEECRCVGGYYDSLTFNFKKCPYCTVGKKEDKTNLFNKDYYDEYYD